MTTSLLLDTNVIIDYLGRRQPFFEDAQKVVAAGFFGDAKLWMSAQSAKDAFYVLCHFSESSAVQDALNGLFDVVAPVSLTAKAAVIGTRLKWRDYKDCLIALAAQDAHADYIITHDEAGFDRSPVPAITPREWLAAQKEKRGIEYDSIKL